MNLFIPEQHLKLFGRDWAAEFVPLRLVALLSQEKLQLLRRLNSLSNDPQVKASGHGDNRAYDRVSVGRVGNLANEGLINFEGIERKLSKIAQAGVARAEVVHRDTHSYFPEDLEDGR